MKSFWTGIAALTVLGLITGLVYNYTAIDMVHGYGEPAAIHVHVAEENLSG